MSQHNHSPIHRRSPLTVSSLPSNSFLTSVSVYAVDEGGHLRDTIGAPVEQVARAAAASGSSEISTDDGMTHADSSAVLAIPVHRNDRVVSVAVLSAKKVSDDNDEVVGVFESWEPVGIYEELALKVGFFGKMERFRNVSSYVRFEKGTGLPGQVWQQRTSVIHDDLSNHPGFLRAAGASADLLVTAIGIPVASKAYHSSALMISSTVSPIARGFEVWQAQENGFSLLGGAYGGFGEGIELPDDFEIPADAGLPGLAQRSGGAALCEEVSLIFAGRNHDAPKPEAASALAIPFFAGDKLTSVATLLF